MTTAISFLNMKGGVGKTTLTVNVGWYLYIYGAKVLIVDLDPQFNATQYLMKYEAFEKHRTEKGTLADILIDQPVFQMNASERKKQDAKEVIVKIADWPEDNSCIHLLPSELNLGWVVKNPAQMEYKLEKFLQKVRDNYDYILIDCAPTESVLTTMALNASNYVITPIRPERYGILGYANFLSNLKAFKENCQDPNNVKALGVIFTQVTSHDIETVCIKEIKAIALKDSDYIFTGQLSHSRIYARAIHNQTAAFLTKHARKNTSIEMKNIVEEMKARIVQLSGST